MQLQLDIHPEAEITTIARRGRIARLLCDWQNPKWDYTVRSLRPEWPNPEQKSPPQTVVFSEDMNTTKDGKIPLTASMRAKTLELNGEFVFRKIMIPAAGWINSGEDPESITWAANDVVVVRVVGGLLKPNGQIAGGWADVHALDYRAQNVQDTFFTKNGRLIIHKFNAVTQTRTLIKLAEGYDAYTPFMQDNLSYWIPTDYLELWPQLPMVIRLGSQSVTIVEYELFGHETCAITDDGRRVVLHDPDGFRSPDWRLATPSVPV